MSLPRPLLWLAGLLALYLAAPFLAVFPQLSQADWASLGHGDLWQAAAVSFASASLAALLIGLGGIPLGYYLAARRDAASRTLGFLVQLPLALPPLASGVLLLFLLGPYSPLGRWAAGLGLPLTDSFAGIVLAETFVAAPFLIVAARSAFAAADRSLEDVAASLGHGAASRFFKVALPQARPAIVAGLLLAWLRAMGEFGATVMVAYHPYSLPVFTYVSFGSEGLPAMLPILLPTLGAVLLIVALIALLHRRPGRSSGLHSAARRIVAAADAAAPLVAASKRTSSHLDVRLRGRRGSFDFDVQWRSEARRIAIVGPSGAGKSLTLRLMAGLETVPGGEVSYNGQALQALPPEQRRLAYVPQHYGLFPHLRVADQLLFAPDATPAAAAYWARRLDLLPLLERRPAELSSGQQQRVALARAMARPGEMILLDEPFAALDTPLRGQLRHLLRSVQEELAATTLLVTHDPQDAAQLADEIVVMADGRVLQHGPALELFRHPGSVRVAELLGIDNVFEAHIDAGHVRLGGAAADGLELPWAHSSPGTPCLARIPSRAVTAAEDGVFSGVVEDYWSTPDGLRLALRIGDTLLQGVAPAGQRLAVGSVLRIAIDAAAIEVWPLGMS